MGIGYQQCTSTGEVWMAMAIGYHPLSQYIRQEVCFVLEIDQLGLVGLKPFLEVFGMRDDRVWVHPAVNRTRRVLFFFALFFRAQC